MDPGIRQDFWAPAYRRGDAGFGDYGLLKFRCVYRDRKQDGFVKIGNASSNFHESVLI